MKPSPVTRFAPIVLLAIVAYAIGYWRGVRMAPSPLQPPSVVGHTAPDDAPPEAVSAPDEPASLAPGEPASPSLADTLAALQAIATAAKTMSVPDARTFRFFEDLTLNTLPAVVDAIRAMEPGNEQDILFTMAIERWGSLDGPTAIEQARAFPALGTRRNALLAAYNAWAAVAATAAYNSALEETNQTLRAEALATVIAGAATRDPREALNLWENAPETFRRAPAGQAAAGQIASAAYGTGKREAIQTLVTELSPEDPARIPLINALVREWGGHYPDDALAWLQSVLPPSEERENIANTMFLSLTKRDPSLAAIWATGYPDDAKRREFIAAAVQEWARLDTLGAETWVNEQPAGPYLDGATYAMAVHYMARQDMARSFAWIRRITVGEMREQMLGTLGRLWSKTNPDDFRAFIENTSLSPIEVRMLTAEVEPAS